MTIRLLHVTVMLVYAAVFLLSLNRPAPAADDSPVTPGAILRLGGGGTKTLIVDSYKGKLLNSPNDLVFKSNGDLYFTDPPFGLPDTYDDTQKGAPDGMKTDRYGNLFGAGPGGVYIFSPDGTLLGIIKTGVPTSNVNWADEGSVLYITASSAIYRIQLNTKGPGF